MKLSILLLVAFVVAVTANVPAVFTKGGEDCGCRKKTCTDVSCEEMHCLCLIEGLKAIINDKSNKYPKEWPKKVLEFIQERCLCIGRCIKICDPKDYGKCVQSAYDRYLCVLAAFLKSIKNHKGYSEFIEDLQRIIAKCINKDCKNACSVQKNCSPFLQPCNKQCVAKVFKSVIALVGDSAVDYIVKEFENFLESHNSQTKYCNSIRDREDRESCLSSHAESFKFEYDRFISQLTAKMGQCSAIALASFLGQELFECNE